MFCKIQVSSYAMALSNDLVSIFLKSVNGSLTDQFQKFEIFLKVFVLWFAMQAGFCD